MPDLVTFVFTDLVGSVDLKGRMPGDNAAERDGAYVGMVLTPHRERIEAGLADHGGRVVSTAGDGHFLAFGDTVQAALWAIGVQQSHRDRPITVGDDDTAAAEVRIGLHVGPPQIDPGDADNYIGRAVDYAARLADRATAGQILSSRSAASLLEDAGLSGLRLHSHGRRALRGIGDVEVHELLYSGREASEPRPDESGETPTEASAQERRNWTVLPPTMSLTQYSGSRPTQNRGSSSTGAAVAPPVRRLGNYELGELIGAGGMGNVYRARHTLFGRTRAVKVIKPELVEAGGDSVVRRFYQEVQATGAIEHPNLVVAIDSSSPEDDQHFLVMEYIDGVGVDRALMADGRLSTAEACEIARQAALGLAHLHQAGLVHRDVKPSNLMLALAPDHGSSGVGSTPQGPRAVVKLMDLGLALLNRGDQQRVTRLDHGGMGTGHYMSPEQWRTTSVDIRADIYSLGCTLHHLIGGRPPFADSDLRPEKAHEREPIPPVTAADTPRALQRLLDRMMAKRPDDRPQTPLEVAEALAPLAAGHRLVDLVERHRGYSHSAPSVAALAGPPQAFGDTSGDRGALDTRRPLPTPDPATAPGRRHTTLWGSLLAAALVAAVALAWVAAEHRNRMLSQSQRLLEVAARGAASVMAEQIEKRFTALEHLADDDKVRGWVQLLNEAATEESDAADARKNLQQWITARKSSRDEVFASNSWFITSINGTQLARAPRAKTIGERYAHRDYFHGQGPDLDRAAAERSAPDPIHEKHQSTVYKSDSTGQIKVAFSVPIENDRGQTIGVLAMSVAVGEFSALGDETVDLLLINTDADYIEEGVEGHGLVLQHPELEQYREAPIRRVPDALLAEVRSQRTSGFLTPYADVFGHDDTLHNGAYAQVVIRNRRENLATGWVVIAQQPAP